MTQEYPGGKREFCLRIRREITEGERKPKKKEFPTKSRQGREAEEEDQRMWITFVFIEKKGESRVTK